MRTAERERRLIDIGSTTALSAMVEIVASAEERPAGAAVGGILSRQVKAMLSRLEARRDQEKAIEGFCDELQSWLESVPALRSTFSASGHTRQNYRR